MAKKVTFKFLQEVDTLVGSLYQKNPKLKDTKFGYAYKRFTDKNYAPLIREFNEELMNIRVDHALEDPTTKEVIIDRMNPRGFKYSKVGMKQVMFEENNLGQAWEAIEIEVTPFLSAYIPEDLDDEQRTMLDGLVL